MLISESLHRQMLRIAGGADVRIRDGGSIVGLIDESSTDGLDIEGRARVLLVSSADARAQRISKGARLIHPTLGELAVRRIEHGLEDECRLIMED